MHNSAMINLNVLEFGRWAGVKRFFYSSSACIYPAYNQTDPKNPKCSEESAYPAEPDSEYGWEKLFSERLYLSYMRNYGLTVRVARFHNIFGPKSTWRGGREKSPAALCRKVADASDGDSIHVWGDGNQTRSFLYISECVEAIRRMMEGSFEGPLNIGSEEMISINELARLIIELAGKRVSLQNVPGPLGVRGRNSDNRLLREKLRWEPVQPLRLGLERTYAWISEQVEAARRQEHLALGSLAAKYALPRNWSTGARFEYFEDRGGLFSGTTQALKQGALVLDHLIAPNFLARAEYRRDLSNQHYFLTDAPGVLAHAQTTATLGLVYWWGTKQGSW